MVARPPSAVSRMQAGMAIGVIAALNDVGYNLGDDPSKTVTVIGVDATDTAIEYINAGKLAGTVKQDGDAMISLGIDIGGTGCKCAAFRDTGVQLALSYREYPAKPGQVNLDPLVLRDSVFAVIRDCAEKLPDAREVAAITVSSFGESFVPLAADGTPLSDIVLYFANSESGEFDRLVSAVGAERFMGGHQMQLNAVNRERLLDAQKHPENYRNLIVRVWGWSGYFVELNEVYQNHIIKRAEMAL